MSDNQNSSSKMRGGERGRIGKETLGKGKKQRFHLLSLHYVQDTNTAAEDLLMALKRGNKELQRKLLGLLLICFSLKWKSEQSNTPQSLLSDVRITGSQLL